MSPSEQRRAIKRSRKAFAFFSETGKAGTEMFYTDCPEKIQIEANRTVTIVWDLFFINFLR
jgi:hypothetical protein